MNSNLQQTQQSVQLNQQQQNPKQLNPKKPNILRQIKENFGLLMGIGFLLNFGSNVMTNFIGVSGSGMLFSLLIYFFGYSTKDAIPVYKFCNLMASFINMAYIFTARKKNNQNELNLDWNLAGYCIPLLITGSMIGILISDFFPSFYLMLIIIATLIIVLLLMMKKKPKKIENFENTGKELVENFDSPLIKFQALKEKEEKISLVRIFFLNKRALLIIFFSFCSLILGNLVKGSEESPSWFFTQCSFFSFIFYFFFVYIPTFLGMSQVSKLEVQFDKSKLLKIGVYSVISGIITSFGISGSLIFTSSLIILQLEPMALTSLSRLSMFMSSLAAVIQFFLEGNLNVEDALVIGSISVLGSLVGVYLFFLFQKQKNKQMVSKVLQIILVLSIVIMPFLTIYEVKTNPEALSFGFIC